LNILISAGPTLEPIDAVRFISNRSSGKMGVALAQSALDAGHEVTVVHGPLSVNTLEHGTWLPVERAQEMLDTLAERMDWADVLIMSAAVCDMRPVLNEGDEGQNTKVDKSQLQQLNFVANPDIVATLAQRFNDVHIVSFSLENDLSVDRPLEKMRAKKSNWVVYNQLRSIGANSSTFGILDREGHAILAPQELEKTELAKHLVQQLVSISPKKENH
jgi:phosphopantothenoylcysteine decarboxylase/phosphopantothenate--cysteine ligase